jgi:hypothetical protein
MNSKKDFSKKSIKITNNILKIFNKNIERKIIILLSFLYAYIFYFKIRVAIVAIGKSENHYIKEWVEHYYNLGVNKIFLYDNNDIDGEKFEDEIAKYIKSGYVEIINYRGIKPNSSNIQSLAYLDCYKNRMQNFD